MSCCRFSCSSPRSLCFCMNTIILKANIIYSIRTALSAIIGVIYVSKQPSSFTYVPTLIPVVAVAVAFSNMGASINAGTGLMLGTLYACFFRWILYLIMSPANEVGNTNMTIIMAVYLTLTSFLAVLVLQDMPQRIMRFFLAICAILCIDFTVSPIGAIWPLFADIAVGVCIGFLCNFFPYPILARDQFSFALKKSLSLHSRLADVLLTAACTSKPEIAKVLMKKIETLMASAKSNYSRLDALLTDVNSEPPIRSWLRCCRRCCSAEGSCCSSPAYIPFPNVDVVNYLSEQLSIFEALLETLKQVDYFYTDRIEDFSRFISESLGKLAFTVQAASLHIVMKASVAPHRHDNNLSEFESLDIESTQKLLASVESHTKALMESSSKLRMYSYYELYSAPFPKQFDKFSHRVQIGNKTEWSLTFSTVNNFFLFNVIRLSELASDYLKKTIDVTDANTSSCCMSYLKTHLLCCKRSQVLLGSLLLLKY